MSNTRESDLILNEAAADITLAHGDSFVIVIHSGLMFGPCSSIGPTVVSLDNMFLQNLFVVMSTI